MLRKTLNLSILRAIFPEILLLATAILMLGLVLCAPLAFAEGTEAEDTSLSAAEAKLWDAYTHGDVIRLHVLADSDDAEAQRVKLAVRDALLLAFGEQLELAGTCDSEAVYDILRQSSGPMREVAEHCARKNGFDGAVTATVGTLLLPAKSYGKITLPQGKYRGLRVTLGSGEGQNWWCVLFPQLCLAVAGEEPWQAQGAAAGQAATQPLEQAADTPPVQPSPVWDAAQIFRCWTSVGLQ